MNWETIIVTILTSNVVIAILSLIRYFIERKHKDEKDKDIFSRALHEIHAVYDGMNHILEKTGAARVSIIKITDSGAVPAVDIPLYTTVLYEVTKFPLEPLKESIQHVRCEADFVEVLKETSIKNVVGLETSRLKKGALKDILETTGVSFTEFYKMAVWDDVFIVMSVEFVDNVELGAKYRSTMRLTLSQIKRLFENKELVS